MCGLERLDPFGDFSHRRLGVVVVRLGRCGKPGLELVPQSGQLGQIGVVREGLTEAGLLVSQLRFRDGKVLPDTSAVGAVGVGQTLQRIQDGTRPLMLS